MHRKGVLKTLIMGIVISEGPVHGYRVYRKILELSSGMWKPSIGTIYRLLGELIEEGCIRKEEVLRGRRRIIYYTATEKGLREFLRITRDFTSRVLVGLSLISMVAGRLPDDKELIGILKEIRLNLKGIRVDVDKALHELPEEERGGL